MRHPVWGTMEAVEVEMCESMRGRSTFGANQSSEYLPRALFVLVKRANRRQ